MLAKRRSRAIRSRLRRILGGTLLEHAAEFLPEHAAYFSRSSRGELCEHIERPPRQCRAHGLDLRIPLQELARNVERQVARVDYALDEAQVQRQKLLGVVHDEDALHVELEAARLVAIPQIERRVRGHVQQACVVALALDAVVAPGERIGAVVRDVLVELAVLLVLDLGARAGPERLRVVDGFVCRLGVLAPSDRMRTGTAM